MTTPIQNFGKPQTQASASLDHALALKAAHGGAENPFIEEAYDVEEEARLQSTAYEKVEGTFYVKKGLAQYVSPAAPKAKAFTYGKQVTDNDRAMLRFLGRIGFATAEQLSYLFTTEQKVTVTRDAEGKVVRETSKVGGTYRVVKPRTAYNRLKGLEEKGYVASKTYALGTVWFITKSGLGYISNQTPGFQTVKLDSLTPMGISGDQVPHRLMIAQVAVGILSADDFFKSKLGLKEVPEQLEDLIVDRQIDSWKWAKRNELRGENGSGLEFPTWRSNEFRSRAEAFKRGELEASELMEDEPSLWASGFIRSLLNPTAKERTFDLVMNREKYRQSLTHLSMAFEVERTAKTEEAYGVWLNTFFEELKIEGGPYARVFIVTAATEEGKKIQRRIRNADRKRAIRIAGVENASSEEAKSEAVKKFGLVGAGKRVKLITTTRLDGSPYDPDTRF